MNNKEHCKKYYQEHRAQIIDKAKQHYLENKDSIKIYIKKWKQSEHGKQVMADWREKRRDICRKYDRDWRASLKEEVLTHYGGDRYSCVKCGFKDIRALTLDHINGGGRKHRKNMKNRSSYKFYAELKRENYPEGYQTLCMNCQFIKRFENNEIGNYKNAV